MRIRFYGVLFLLSFLVVYLLILRTIKRNSLPYSPSVIQNYFVWSMIGIIVGARLGYVFWYDFAYFSQNPLAVISPFDFSSGMRFTGIRGLSYHGGLIGMIVVLVLFCKKNHINIWQFTNCICPAIPLGYTFGRIGNFINGELYGRVTTSPWGMYFPQDPLQNLRHASQLYEAFFEGIVLFVILRMLQNHSAFKNHMAAFYVSGYGVIRFFIEFTREPDSQLGFVWGPLSMGQLLCLGMVVFGLLIYAYQQFFSKTQT